MMNVQKNKNKNIRMDNNTDGSRNLEMVKTEKQAHVACWQVPFLGLFKSKSHPEMIILYLLKVMPLWYEWKHDKLHLPCCMLYRLLFDN